MPLRGAGGRFGTFFDSDEFVEEITERAIRGLNSTLLLVQSRAKEKAPVRAIFRRSPRGKPEYPRAILTFKTKEPSYAAVIKALRKHPIETQHAHDMYKRSVGERRRRIDVPPHFIRGASRGEEAFTEPTQVKGHFNSEQPVLPEEKGGKSYITGNFRQVRNGKLEVVPFARRPGHGGKAYIAGAMSAEGFLTNRGRAEVKSGRAKITGPTGEEQIGGALKNSIEVEDVVAVSDGYAGYVTAGNAKVYYARFQEFGTAHNRAHPFMRPALYESRADFKRLVEAAIKSGS